MSRIVGKEHLLDELSKYTLEGLIKRMCRFCGIELVTHCVMSNHFHILVRVGGEQNPSDEELIKRMEALYGKRGRLVELAREGLGKEGKVPEDIRSRMLRRMGDISVLMQEIKQRFSRWYNRRMDRPGTMWAERFRSVVVEDNPEVVLRVACYIDLNPVRGADARDPKDYRYSTYGAAVRGDKEAREAVMKLVGSSKWNEAQRIYRQQLYTTAGRAGSSGKAVLSDEEIKKVIKEGGELSFKDLMMLKIRHITDGVALGTEAFVERVYVENRDKFGVKRKSGARRIPGMLLGEVYALRDLKVRAIE
jgi:REP element-mobilizing transposase RayT